MGSWLHTYNKLMLTKCGCMWLHTYAWIGVLIAASCARKQSIVNKQRLENKPCGEFAGTFSKINFSSVFSLFSAVHWLKSLPLHNCFSSMVSHKANAVHEGMKMLAHIASMVTAHIPSEYHQGDKRKQLDEDCDIMHMLITSSQYSFDWFDWLLMSLGHHQTSPWVECRQRYANVTAGYHRSAGLYTSWASRTLAHCSWWKVCILEEARKQPMGEFWTMWRSRFFVQLRGPTCFFVYN